MNFSYMTTKGEKGISITGKGLELHIDTDVKLYMLKHVREALREVAAMKRANREEKKK